MANDEGLSDLVLELRAERERLVQQVAAWRDRVIGLLDAYETAIGQPGLSDAYRHAFRKCRRDLLRAVQPLGLDAIEPKPSDLFDEQLHRVVGEANEPGADQSRIEGLRRSGYRIGSDVLRHAEVTTGFIGRTDDDAAEAPTRAPHSPRNTFEELVRAAERNAKGAPSDAA